MALELSYTYRSCVESSEKVSWRLDDVFPSGTRLDFARPFLPESLASTRDVATITFLDNHERRALNQIAGNAYMNLFGFIEEYILATMVKHAQAEMFGNHDAIRALVRFSDEEAKHQALFARFRDAFDRDFGVPAKVLDNAAEVAGTIMSRSPIAVMLVTLQLELMTQLHYTESVRDDQGIDPVCQSILKHHWLEEAQHARIDVLELKKLVDDATPAQVEQGFSDYLDLLDSLHDQLRAQARMDAQTLALKFKRTLDAAETASLCEHQQRTYDRTFIWSGMTHPMFVEITTRIDAPQAKRVAERAARFA